MALSRIWCAFIIIAISVAGFKYFFVADNYKVFSQMVVGKKMDTSYTKTIDSIALPAKVAVELQKNKEFELADNKYFKLADSKYTVCKNQQANGILETCADGVNLCLGLIGIMAFFMGLMSIAEKAGGIRFLSKLIAPFFTKLFPDVPKDHPAMGLTS